MLLLERLILVDVNPDVVIALRQAFKDLPGCEVVLSRFEDLPEFDCMVSAANSFGLMDGGVDQAIINFFGEALQTRVQELIKLNYLGEQPVGTSMIVETMNSKHPFLAHSPTMRVPLPVTNTDNAYNAMRATLLAVHHHNRKELSNNIAGWESRMINTLACPGLGTLAGKLPPEEGARQMALAYAFTKLNDGNGRSIEIDWERARAVQRHVRFGGDPTFYFKV